MENPFGIAALVPLLDAMKAPIFGILAVPVFVGPVASVVTRFRRGTAAERAQLKWLIAATGVAVIAWVVVAVGEATGSAVLRTAGWYGGLVAFVGLPLAIGIAVLRYRLYEIDRIISRTIAWALVTGVLVSVFAGGVVALQAALIGVTQGERLPSPLRLSSRQRCSSHCVDASSASSTDGSTARHTTPSGRSRRSRYGFATRWHWMPSRPTCSRRSRTRSDP